MNNFRGHTHPQFVISSVSLSRIFFSYMIIHSLSLSLLHTHTHTHTYTLLSYKHSHSSFFLQRHTLTLTSLSLSHSHSHTCRSLPHALSLKAAFLFHEFPLFLVTHSRLISVKIMLFSHSNCKYFHYFFALCSILSPDFKR